MRRNLQHPYTTRHTYSRNPRNPEFLASRIPVLLLQVPTGSKRIVLSMWWIHSADNTWKNAGHRMSLAMVVALKVISRNVARSQVTSQKIVLTDRISQSPSTGPGKNEHCQYSTSDRSRFLRWERSLPKEYTPQNQPTGSMYVLKKFQGNPSNDILFSDNGVEIQHDTPTSVSDPDPAPILSPDFPFLEFPLTEVVDQSQIDYYSISDTSEPRECSISSSKATKSTDLPLKSGLNSSTHEEMALFRDLTVSTAPTQSLRDSNTIFTPDNSATRESNPGITTGITTDTPSTPTTFSEETDVTGNSCRNSRRTPNAYKLLQVCHSYWYTSPNSSPEFNFRWLPCEEYTFYSKKGRRDSRYTFRITRWNIPADPEDPQSTPRSPMGSPKAPFIA